MPVSSVHFLDIIVFLKCKCDHVTSVFQNLHWLLIGYIDLHFTFYLHFPPVHHTLRSHNIIFVFLCLSMYDSTTVECLPPCLPCFVLRCCSNIIPLILLLFSPGRACCTFLCVSRVLCTYF